MTVIGVVRSITRHESFVAYTIEDGSGAIDAVEWTKNDTRGENSMFDESTIRFVVSAVLALRLKTTF